MFTWLIEGGVGPALVAVPVNWASDALAGSARHWFRRFRRTDDLSRLVRAVTGTSVGLTRTEFAAVRRLLEDSETWNAVGRGTIEDLVSKIAACLPPLEGRTAKDSLGAARTIARGLLEFAVADLAPEMFQRLVLTRLQRLEINQASALDAALFELHADLAARLDASREFDGQHFSRVMAELKSLLGQLPPGPAGRGEIVVYLRTLFDWLNTDPWPRDRRFDGPALTPTAIERKLRITASVEQDLDADALAAQCHRLVVLGGPGSGKTWLARRSARRSAKDALDALAMGRTLAEIELPLYTTCSRLVSAEGDIRAAAVSSAIDQLGDLGSSRLSAAIRVFFTERNAPTLLVIDSLDEAHDADERLRQADTLPWRIILTSRPRSWNQQFVINRAITSHKVGELQPLRYPEDVEPFIGRWFHSLPRKGEELVKQIAQRPGLQQASTVPLILAFYCIVGGSDTPLPEFRRDLYTMVLNRMLTGRWRGSADFQADVGNCLRTLRAWAWSAAVSDPDSGIGKWADDFPVHGVQLCEADEMALDHVATPISPVDVDTGKTLRRFIHRAIREHLVAEHVASLPLDEAVEALLPHLWYDPDWEYSAAAALAMHSEHDQLVRNLICRATYSKEFSGELSAVDPGGEFRRLLARVADESSETDWSPEVAKAIGQARLELAMSGRSSHLGRAASWKSSNRQARHALVSLVEREANGSVAAQLSGDLIELDPTPEDKRQTRNALLTLLLQQTNGRTAVELAARVVRLDPTRKEKYQARSALFRLLVSQTDNISAELARAWVGLDPTSEEKHLILLQLLADQTDSRVVARFASGVIQLDSTAEDKRQICKVLLRLLAGDVNDWVAAELVGRLVPLVPMAERAQARKVLLRLLADQTDGWIAARLANGIVQLDPTVEDKRQALDALLKLLTRRTDSWTGSRSARLYLRGEERYEARDALLGVLTSDTDERGTAGVVGAVVQLDPTAEDKRQARNALLGVLTSNTDGALTAASVGGIVQLDPTAEDKRQARNALLTVLTSNTDPWAAEDLAVGLLQLDPSPEDKRQARNSLLRLLIRQTNPLTGDRVVSGLLVLDPRPEEKAQARDALLKIFADQADGWWADELAYALAPLGPTAEDKRHARHVLLSLLTRHANADTADRVVSGLVELDPTPEEKAQARDALLGVLTSHTRARNATGTLNALAQLDPTVRDLDTWRAWTVPPTAELLAAVRLNSSLTHWLAALPSLPLLIG